MGVWERSPAGLAIAEADPGLDAGNRAALPDLRPEDVIGSPYCVRDYVVDERFGGPAALARPRAAGGARARADPRLRAQPRRARPSVADVAARAASSAGIGGRPGARPDGVPAHRGPGSSPAGATPTSRRGRTSSSSTRSRPSCARRSPRRCSTSAPSATGCAATWRC